MEHTTIQDSLEEFNNSTISTTSENITLNTYTTSTQHSGSILPSAFPNWPYALALLALALFITTLLLILKKATSYKYHLNLETKTSDNTTQLHTLSTPQPTNVPPISQDSIQSTAIELSILEPSGEIADITCIELSNID
jgi:hypothetical protein